MKSNEYVEYQDKSGYFIKKNLIIHCSCFAIFVDLFISFRIGLENLLFCFIKTNQLQQSISIWWWNNKFLSKCFHFSFSFLPMFVFLLLLGFFTHKITHKFFDLEAKWKCEHWIWNYKVLDIFFFSFEWFNLLSLFFFLIKTFSTKISLFSIKLLHFAAVVDVCWSRIVFFFCSFISFCFFFSFLLLCCWNNHTSRT